VVFIESFDDVMDVQNFRQCSHHLIRHTSVMVFMVETAQGAIQKDRSCCSLVTNIMHAASDNDLHVRYLSFHKSGFRR